MKSNTVLLVCRTATKQHWQLGKLPPDEGTLLLIGWRLFPRPVDGGVPQHIAVVIANALTSAVKVSFPSLDLASLYGQSNGLPQTSVDLLKSNCPAAGMKSLLGGAPRTISLFTTKDASTVTHLFTDSAFAWHMQGQIALLCPASGNTPVLGRDELLSLMSDEWTKNIAALRQRGITGAIRPGVDGDLLGILIFDEQCADNLLHALEYEAERAGIEWRVVSEDAFEDMLADG